MTIVMYRNLLPTNAVPVVPTPRFKGYSIENLQKHMGYPVSCSPIQNRFWCILDLKSDIWLQQF